jgi:DNA uptake protein ComE-like DNA-binding protein
MARNCRAQSRESDPSLAYKKFYQAYAPPSSPSRSSSSARSASSSPSGDLVDINRASLDQLLKVRGMTPTWAARIVRFRPYRTKRDLLEHGVVSGEVYDRIKDSIIAHREPR